MDGKYLKNEAFREQLRDDNVIFSGRVFSNTIQISPAYCERKTFDSFSEWYLHNKIVRRSVNGAYIFIMLVNFRCITFLSFIAKGHFEAFFNYFICFVRHVKNELL